jgi:hypothetical protein
MRNQDGYEIVPSVIEAVSYGDRFVTFKTDCGTFCLLTDQFTWVPAKGTPVILYFKGLSEVVGLTTRGAKNFYIKPSEYDRYEKKLLGKE